MISSLTLADRTGTDIPLQSMSSPYKRNIVMVTGLMGTPNLRTVTRPRPVGHGGINDTRWSDGSLIAITGEVISQVSQADAWAEFHKLVAPMQDTLDTGAALMKWQEGATGNLLQKAVKLASDVDPPVEGVGAILNYQAQFFAEDPRAYSQTLQTVTSATLSTAAGGLTFPMKFPITFTPSSGGTVAVTNNGNRKTPPIFKVYGYCINPVIVNVTTGDRITVNGTIASGDYLEIGTDSSGQRYAKYNGTTLQNNLIDSTTTQWFELGSGVSNLQMLSGTFDGFAQLSVLFRDAYA